MREHVIDFAFALGVTVVTVGLCAGCYMLLTLLFASAPGEADEFAATRDQWEARGRGVKGS